MTGKTTIQITRVVKSALDQICAEINATSANDAIRWLLEQRRFTDQLALMRAEIETLRNELALLRKQQGVTGKGNQTGV